MTAGLAFGGGSSDNVSFGSPANLDNLAQGAILLAFSVSNVNDQLRVFASKYDVISSTDRGPVIYRPSGGYGGTSMRLDLPRATTWCVCRTQGWMAVDTWYWMVVCWDTNGASGDQKLFYGTRNGTISEPAYHTRGPGSGAQNDDSAVNFKIGDDDFGNDRSFPGAISIVGVWDTPLSQAEVEMQRRRYERPAVARSNCQLYCLVGRNGTGTQIDLSGNGNNGTVTGATRTGGIPLTVDIPASWQVLPTVGRTTRNTDTHPLGIHTAMSWRLPTHI